MTASLAVTTAVSTPAPVQAQTYQIDCAILLCLAGGWPASVPCARARAEFIRRITPWPVEPPLQIWRCPMGASVSGGAPLSPMERLYDIAFREPHESVLSALVPAAPEFVLAQAEERADIDISGDAFDFVRSIRVYHIQFSQHQNRDGDCIRSDSTRLGSYGTQGDYGWARSSVAAVPEASDLAVPEYCRSYSWRSVFVDWRDHAGNYGSEEVRY
ncbi:hypothetical protein [Haematobacter massiliensis]|uniref:hypothetical protein n=1 Tax=Haematobacter massiliensis TaxID=195105 RepID=UPI001F6042A0|nr:hypothetical protein [Haematobacter massiliensis]